nr:type I-C CRISPR-associated protein Cas8c/Csd1 [Methylocucumis oryzae]
MENHSKFIRHSSDGAKLVSSNDENGYTYRGKFLDKTQACGISFEVSQKAHNALRWLIARQGYKSGDKDPQVYVSWAVSGKDIPEPLADVREEIYEEADLSELPDEESSKTTETTLDYSTDLGAAYANNLRKNMAGYFKLAKIDATKSYEERLEQYIKDYEAKLDPHEQIIIMGLDSATPGRMGILYYRELLSHEFLERLKNWHSEFAWYQRHTQEIPNDTGKKPKTKVIYPISSPIPRDIAKAAYGENVTDNLKKKVIERLMPCIVDGYPFPFDLVQSCVRKATNRVAYANDEQWLWEKNLGITCALFKGYWARYPTHEKRRFYTMALDRNYHARDYLYGRLLAVAERIEEIALSAAEENRSTNAARLMQRFADHPAKNVVIDLQSVRSLYAASASVAHELFKQPA